MSLDGAGGGTGFSITGATGGGSGLGRTNRDAGAGGGAAATDTGGRAGTTWRGLATGATAAARRGRGCPARERMRSRSPSSFEIVPALLTRRLPAGG